LSLQREDHQCWVVPEIGTDSIGFDEVNVNESSEICIFIGPEGGFSERELEHLQKQGATFHELGDLRLRAETAAWKTITLVNELIN
jgi:RsmE family RNA methyltransferase